MADEDLQRNPFWRALNSPDHAALFATVAKQKLTVCVPVCDFCLLNAACTALRRSNRLLTRNACRFRVVARRRNAVARYI